MIVGLSCQLALQSHPDAGFLMRVRVGGSEKRLILTLRTMSVLYGPWKQPHLLDDVSLCESGLGAHVEAPVM